MAKPGIKPRGWYHGGRQPSSDNSLHSPTVIPLLALDKPSIMKHYHHRWTCCHTSHCRSPTMVTLHDTPFVQCRWWNDGWTVKTVVTWRSSASMIPAPGLCSRGRRLNIRPMRQSIRKRKRGRKCNTCVSSVPVRVFTHHDVETASRQSTFLALAYSHTHIFP